MARVKIKVPGNYIYKTTLPVRVDDINYGGHMGNDAILKFAHEARLRFMKSINFDEMNFYNHSLIMSDAAISYKKEIFQGDLLDCEIYIDDIGSYGFDFIYKFINNNKTSHIVKTGMVFYNYETKKVTKTPKDFQEKYDV